MYRYRRKPSSRPEQRTVRSSTRKRVRAQMKRAYAFAAPLLSGSLAFGQVSEHSTLVNDVAKMPAQMQAATFSQEAFEASLESAVSDPTLDFTRLNPLLESDLKSSDVKVRRYAALVVSQLASGRPNSTEELEPLLPTIVAAVDDSDRGVQLGSIVAATELHPAVPESVVILLRSRLTRDDVNHESYAMLAGALTKIRPNDPATDTSVIAFLRNTRLSEDLRAQAIQEMGSPNLSDSITGEIVGILSSRCSDQIKLAALLASEKIGPRALSLEKESLAAIQSDETKSASLREEASRALGMPERQ